MTTLHLRRIAVAAAFVLTGAAHIAQSPPATAVAATPPTFGEPTISGVQGNGFEQDIRLDRQGRVYTSAPDSLSSTVSTVWRSLDRGQTFKWVPAAQQPSGKLDTCVGGGDAELATDSANNLYFNDLTLANFSTSRSGNQGRTFVPASCTGVSDVVVDRQWYAVDGNPTNGGNIFLAYDQVAQATPVTCPNGGIAQVGNNLLVIARSPFFGGSAAAGVQFASSQPISCDEGIMGNDEFFNYPDHGKRVFVIHDNANFNSVSMGRCDVTATPPPPVGLTGLTNCVDVLISSFPNGKTGGNFPTMTIDRAGHLFATWEQAPVDGSGKVGNSVLMFSTSSDEGDTWTTPQQLPTPGLNNNVFAWPAAGDSGRIDVAWYGTPAGVSPGCVSPCGPDTVQGDWSLWMAQTLDNGAHWTAPILAGEHFIHRGNIQTVMGGQVGDRTLGDFLQVRIGLNGEANISYADSNNRDEFALPHAMFVRQNGGSSVFAEDSIVNGSPAPVNAVSDPSGDATFDNLGLSTANQPNLDILRSSMSMPDANHYRVTMTVADLRSLAPGPTASPAQGTDFVWLTQWLVPSTTDPNGGKNFFVYMESTNGGPAVCYSGENAGQLEGGGIMFTYPGKTQIVGSACSYTATAPGTITITVPTASVAEAAPINNILYSVTASTLSLLGPNEAVTGTTLDGILPSLVDVARAYDFNPALPTPGGGGGCHEGEGDGAIQGKKGGEADFHMQEGQCQDQSNDGVDVKDSGDGTDFHSTQIESVAFNDLTKTMVVHGSGLDNGNPVTFTATGVDNGSSLLDTFSITLSDGYTNAGRLISGAITIR